MKHSLSKLSFLTLSLSSKPVPGFRSLWLQWMPNMTRFHYWKKKYQNIQRNKHCHSIIYSSAANLHVWCFPKQSYIFFAKIWVNFAVSIVVHWLASRHITHTVTSFTNKIPISNNSQTFHNLNSILWHEQTNACACLWAWRVHIEDLHEDLSRKQRAVFSCCLHREWIVHNV